MTLWLKYNFILVCGPLASFLFFFICALMGYLIAGLIIMGIGIISSSIVLLGFVCPKCNTPLSSSSSIFSKHYKGQIFIPTKCVNCGFDLNAE